MGQPLYCSAMPVLACGEREAMVMAPPTMRDSAVSLASMAARLSSTGISHHNLFPHMSSIYLSAVNSSLCPGIAPQSWTPAPSHCPFQETRVPAWHMYGCSKDSLILIPFRLSQVSYFTLSLTCFSSDSDNCPAVGIGPLLQFLHPRRAGPVLLTLLFFPLVPLSYRVLHGSIYSFPLVRYSCRLSAGFLHAPLSLKVYSRYICGERHTPRPPTPLSSCSPIFFFISK